jgi:hypothetical protein
MVARPFLKRRQQLLKPRDSPDITVPPKPLTVVRVGAASMKPSIGEGSSIRPRSWTDAKAQNGLPGKLGDPAHVHVSASRQSGRRLNNDPGPEPTHTTSRRSRILFYRFSAATFATKSAKVAGRLDIRSPGRRSQSYRCGVLWQDKAGVLCVSGKRIQCVKITLERNTTTKFPRDHPIPAPKAARK